MASVVPLVLFALFLAVTGALLFARVPRRWLAPALLGWILAPAILLGGTLIVALALGPTQENGLSNAAFAFMLIATIMAVPWLILCGIAFAIGLALRRRMPPPEPQVPRAPSAPTIPARREGPGPFAAWRAALVIFVGAIGAIAGLTWLSMETGIEPPRVGIMAHVPRIPH